MYCMALFVHGLNCQFFAVLKHKAQTKRRLLRSFFLFDFVIKFFSLLWTMVKKPPTTLVNHTDAANKKFKRHTQVKELNKY